MLNINDNLDEQLKLKKLEEKKCSDNICKKKVRQRYGLWSSLADIRELLN